MKIVKKDRVALFLESFFRGFRAFRGSLFPVLIGLFFALLYVAMLPAELSGAPYGYRYIRKTDDAPASYAPIEDEARVVRHAYELYTVRGLSIGAVTRWLNDQGVVTRKPGARWERSTVWAMLRNPAYRGRACFGKTRVVTRQRLTRRLRLRAVIPNRNSANQERPRDPDRRGDLDREACKGVEGGSC